MNTSKKGTFQHPALEKLFYPKENVFLTGRKDLALDIVKVMGGQTAIAITIDCLGLLNQGFTEWVVGLGNPLLRLPYNRKDNVDVGLSQVEFYALTWKEIYNRYSLNEENQDIKAMAIVMLFYWYVNHNLFSYGALGSRLATMVENWVSEITSISITQWAKEAREEMTYRVTKGKVTTRYTDTGEVPCNNILVFIRSYMETNRFSRSGILDAEKKTISDFLRLSEESQVDYFIHPDKSRMKIKIRQFFTDCLSLADYQDIQNALPFHYPKSKTGKSSNDIGYRKQFINPFRRKHRD